MFNAVRYASWYKWDTSKRFVFFVSGVIVLKWEYVKQIFRDGVFIISLLVTLPVLVAVFSLGLGCGLGLVFCGNGCKLGSVMAIIFIKV